MKEMLDHSYRHGRQREESFSNFPDQNHPLSPFQSNFNKHMGRICCILLISTFPWGNVSIFCIVCTKTENMIPFSYKITKYILGRSSYAWLNPTIVKSSSKPQWGKRWVHFSCPFSPVKLNRSFLQDISTGGISTSCHHRFPKPALQFSRWRLNLE